MGSVGARPRPENPPKPYPWLSVQVATRAKKIGMEASLLILIRIILEIYGDSIK